MEASTNEQKRAETAHYSKPEMVGIHYNSTGKRDKSKLSLKWDRLIHTTIFNQWITAFKQYVI